MSQEFGKETKGRGFVLSHSFDTDNEEYKKYPTKWTDDTRSDWTVEKPLVKFNPWVPNIAFKENIAMFTDPEKASSKIPFLTNDLGGFDMGLTTNPEEELFIRWLQFSMFNPITEVFSQPENPTANMAWLYSERADTIFRFYSHLRMQLFPYIYSYALRSRIEGKHMLGKFPEHIYQYTFGDEMLLAPVYVKGGTTQKLFLPEGKWINYWTGEAIQGNTEYTVAAPISQVPLFIKQGSIIPMRNYASSVEKGNNNTLTLHVYPGADGSFNLLEDDGTSNEYLSGSYASTLIWMKNSSNKFDLQINPLKGNYQGMGVSRKWILNIHSSRIPEQILLNRTRLNFNYDKKKQVIIAETTEQPVNQLLKFDVRF